MSDFHLMDKCDAIDAINGMIDNNGTVIPQNFGVCSRKILFAKEFDLEEHDAKIREDAIEKFDKIIQEYEPFCPIGLLKAFDKIKKK